MDLHGIVVLSVPQTHKDLIQPCVLCELQEGYKMGRQRNGDFFIYLYNHSFIRSMFIEILLDADAGPGA